MPRALVWLLFPVMALAQSEEIAVRLRRVLATSDHSQDALAAFSRKDFTKVESILGSAKAPGESVRAELLSLRGAVEFLAGNMSAAVSSFREAAELGPLIETDTFTLAMAFVRLGDDDQARPVLACLAQQHPQRALYLYWLGRLDYDQRRYEEAIQKLTKAASLDATSARTWDSLGLAFDMVGDFEHARTAFQKASLLNRDQAHPSPWPPHDLGFLLLRMDQPREAESALRESLRYDATLAPAHYHLGRALEKDGKDEEAVEEYKKASVADTGSTDACYSLALLLRRLHRQSEADEMFTEIRRRKQTSLPPEPSHADSAN